MDSQIGEKDKMKEGWAQIFNVASKRMLGKFHYFRGGTSLCGKYTFYSSFVIEGHHGHSIQFGCKICKKLLEEEAK